MKAWMTAVALVMGAAAMFATQGCGPVKAKCSISNCSGCCDANDACQPGNSGQACGANGNTCNTCGAGQFCRLAICGTFETGGNGGSGGGVGGTGGTAGSGGGTAGTGGTAGFGGGTAGTGGTAGVGGGTAGGGGLSAFCDTAKPTINMRCGSNAQNIFDNCVTWANGSCRSQAQAMFDCYRANQSTWTCIFGGTPACSSQENTFAGCRGTGGGGAGGTGGSGGGGPGGTGGVGGGGAVAPSTPLSRAVPIVISGVVGSVTYYSVNLATTSSQLTVQISGGTGDANIYVNSGSMPPALTSWSHMSEVSTQNSEVPVAPAPAGTWYIAIKGYTAFSGITLRATW